MHVQPPAAVAQAGLNETVFFTRSFFGGTGSGIAGVRASVCVLSKMLQAGLNKTVFCTRSFFGGTGSGLAGVGVSVCAVQNA